MKDIKIIKLDNQGRGIAYIDNIITFVRKALPNEIVDIEIVKEKKKYKEAKIQSIKEVSLLRKEVSCPYFSSCGGCDLLHLSYEETLHYKKEKLQNILKKYGNIERKISIIPSDFPLSYRNKITLKIKDKQIGYYEEDSHKLLSINNCLLAEEPIQKMIQDIKYLHIRNGEVIIRSNFNQELLLWIKTEEEISPDLDYMKKYHKIAGIIINEKCIVGEPYLMEKIHNQFFKVSYDSFFQINRNICEKLFTKMKSYVSLE